MVWCDWMCSWRRNRVLWLPREKVRYSRAGPKTRDCATLNWIEERRKDSGQPQPKILLINLQEIQDRKFQILQAGSIALLKVNIMHFWSQWVCKFWIWSQSIPILKGRAKGKPNKELILFMATNSEQKSLACSQIGSKYKSLSFMTSIFTECSTGSMGRYICTPWNHLLSFQPESIRIWSFLGKSIWIWRITRRTKCI